MTLRTSPLRVGAGASFADDRIAPAVDLAERGELDYLVFECLAERTIARENQTRRKDPSKGYTPRMLDRLGAVLPACLRNDVRIVSNMGAANPVGAAQDARRHAREAGLGDLHCAVVTGDDVSEIIRRQPQLPLMESGEPVESLLPRMVSANAYLGADVLCRALDTGARLVLSGRVADPSLFLAPAIHHYGWRYDDWPLLAAGTAVGHLLECSAQVSGGCFGDRLTRKDVPDLARLGFPLAEIHPDGSFVVTKLDGTGGRVDIATCTEQLLYELHDPAEYITPDCVLDITDVMLEQLGPDRVRLLGARGRPRTPSYKVTVGYDDGYIGEGQISYAGINAVDRARWAAEVVQQRLADRGFTYRETRVDLIGMSSLHGMGAGRPEPYEVRMRIAMRTDSRKAAEQVGFETRALHVNGPGGGGGGSDPVVREVLAVKSVLIPRALVDPQVQIQEMLK